MQSRYNLWGRSRGDTLSCKDGKLEATRCWARFPQSAQPLVRSCCRAANSVAYFFWQRTRPASYWAYCNLRKFMIQINVIYSIHILCFASQLWIPRSRGPLQSIVQSFFEEARAKARNESRKACSSTFQHEFFILFPQPLLRFPCFWSCSKGTMRYLYIRQRSLLGQLWFAWLWAGQGTARGRRCGRGIKSTNQCIRRLGHSCISMHPMRFMNALFPANTIEQAEPEVVKEPAHPESDPQNTKNEKEIQNEIFKFVV